MSGGEAGTAVSGSDGDCWLISCLGRIQVPRSRAAESSRTGSWRSCACNIARAAALETILHLARAQSCGAPACHASDLAHFCASLEHAIAHCSGAGLEAPPLRKCLWAPDSSHPMQNEQMGFHELICNWQQPWIVLTREERNTCARVLVRNAPRPAGARSAKPPRAS